MGAPLYSKFPTPTKATSFVGGFGLLLFGIGGAVSRVPAIYVDLANLVAAYAGKPPYTESMVTDVGTKLAIGGACAFFASGIAYALAQVFDKKA